MRSAQPAIAYGSGVVRREELVRAGVAPREVDALVRAGHLRRLHRGTYVARDVAVTAAIRAQAAIEAVEVREVVASHDTAAAVHGIDLVRRWPGEHVTVPRQCRRPHRPGLRIHAHELDDEDISYADGPPVTNVVRTLLDLLLDADRLTAVWGCEHALRQGLASEAELQRRVAAAAGCPRIVRARRRLGIVDARSESPLETAIRLILIDAGVPPPVVQLGITSEGRQVMRLDLAYEEERVAVEADGAGPHELPAALFHDRRRANALQLSGWTLLRFTWPDVARPAYVAATVRAALAAAA